ncbi:putative transcriptional regulator [uncultured Mediterranean phage uvMED]|nr:putative transcriptional regulator [uncultured Mediterranean phage uvMED]
MQQKYEPHIRVKFSLFDSPQFRIIPNKHRAYCYLVFICLLKFANSKTLTCYPRQATLSNMTGLSRSTIFRTTELLERSQIITKKRQKSTTLYTINKDLVVSVRNNDVSTGHMGSVYRTNISRTNITTNSNITNFIKGLAESGSDMNDIVDKIASKYSIQELNEAIKDNDNPYLCKQALQIKDQENVKYVSKDVINKAVKDVQKNTNYFYKNKVAENKRKHGRISATKSFLSRSNKKK